MKPALLKAYTTMLPRLIAEEDLRAVSVSIAAHIKPDAFRTYTRQLTKATGPQQRGRKVRTVGDLQQAGLDVVETARPKG